MEADIAEKKFFDLLIMFSYTPAKMLFGKKKIGKLKSVR